MGIKHFFYWFRNNFSDQTKPLKYKRFSEIDVKVDNLMIDMNGIFHNSAQKIYKYGNFKVNPRLLKVDNNSAKNQIKVFEDVCEELQKILQIVDPKKRLILCVDGPAPISKQKQQRQRRFRSAMESHNKSNNFDSNSITPGTKFMDYLSKYIDWFIKKQITINPNWQNIEVVFSNEKDPGEGEHKIINYIRKFGSVHESYCIHGLDADLIMLALGTHIKKFYILREDLYDKQNDYFCINIGDVHEKLAEKLQWEDSKGYKFNEKRAINDFIFLCFIVGNDFLPHIPSIEIIQEGIELIIDIYKKVCVSYGHITFYNKNNDIQFVKSSMNIFLNTIGNNEKKNLENKLNKKKSFFKDIVLEKSSSQNEKGKWVVDIDLYKQNYMKKVFPENCDVKKICHEYLEGMQWVLSYYTKGVPNWEWYFKHHYAPPASILGLYIKNFKFPLYKNTTPTTPFQQLLSVLPPQSSGLIPKPLCNLLTENESPMKKFCPENIEIDLSGKRKEWEGIVLLPIVDFESVRQAYDEKLKHVKFSELKRNIFGNSFLYEKTDYIYRLNCYYGDIPNCNVKVKFIKI
jgi:5'-3' exonuclease